MRAFLSHSSLDKDFIREVAERVGAGRTEIDEFNFEYGLPSSRAIQDALRKCDLFVLFLSRSSIQSSYVQFEISFAQELIAAGILKKFLVICLDDESFQAADSSWKIFNFCRRSSGAASAARTVLDSLISIQSSDQNADSPFLGRDEEKLVVRKYLRDPKSPSPKALYVSGNAFVGRRSFAKRVYGEFFRNTKSIFPEINVATIDGLSEIYRKILDEAGPRESMSQRRTRLIAFDSASRNEKVRQIASIVNDSIRNREAFFIVDDGAILQEDGRISEDFAALLRSIESFPHPGLVFIAERIVPHLKRQEFPEVIFVPLPALAQNDVLDLLGILLKENKTSFTPEQLERLAELSDGHPVNAKLIAAASKEKTVSVFLSNTEDFVALKRRQGTRFVKSINLNEAELRILYALREFHSLDFSLLAEISGVSEGIAASAIDRLLQYHVIEGPSNLFYISPPLRPAIERDARVDISAGARRQIVHQIAEKLSVHDEGSEVSLALVDAKILAEIQQGTLGSKSAFYTAFVLPSHYVWLARRRYDARDNHTALRLANRALEDISRLSSAGLVEACRLVCLSAARLGLTADFERAINILRGKANDDWARSNVAFLEGFQLRLRGFIPEAEDKFRISYRYVEGNFQAARELAAICLLRENFADAERFARRAFEIASDNPYVIDTLLAVLLKDRERIYSEEIQDLFYRLQLFSRENRLSFYETRMTEFYLRTNDNARAFEFMNLALGKTPLMLPVLGLQAELLLESGRITSIPDVIRRMERATGPESNIETRGLGRIVIETKFMYNLAIKNFEAARALFRNARGYSLIEIAERLKTADREEAYQRR